DQDLKVFLYSGGLERIELGPATLKTRGDGTMLINFAGPYHTYPHFSMVDVLQGAVPAEVFRDKIVFVGPTAIGIGDIRNTPFAGETYMGVEIHANVVDNLLHLGESSRTFLTRGLNQEMADIAFIVLFGLGLGAWFARTRPLAATLAVVATLLLFILILHFGFARWGIWLSFVVPAGTLVASYAGVTSYRMIFEEREKRRVRKTFSSYVSPGVIRLLEKDPARYFRSGGEMKDLTVMFSDIRGFTSISEGLTPDELVALLNEYLGEMTEILFRRWGTLDKYIGDAIMAFWGSPFPQEDHAERACACALEMSARLRELNAKWKAEGRKQLAIGIGLNTGPVNVGNMGSSRRLSWTVMGDHVNLASRLEGLTKEYGVGIVLSEFTWRAVEGRFIARELDRIRVKGKQQPVGIFELMDSAENGSSRAELLALFAEAMDSYRGQRWQQAAQKFETVLARFPQDGPSRVFLHRSLEFSREAPAADWDGVYVMKSK
ncbi:MAG: adenylate/guanylate cyclase domain-containing protein, partial [Terriglobales bacterium]